MQDKNSPIDRLLTLLAGLLIFSMALVRIGDYDIWYHLRTGQYILSTGAISHLEPYSFAVTDMPWSVQSWLAGVIYYLVYGISGINSVIIFNALLISAAFFFVYRTMRLRAPGAFPVPLAVVMLLVAAFTVRFRMFARPHILEFLFLAVVLYLLTLYSVKRKNYLFLIPIIQIAWVNIHGSNILGLLLPLVFLAGEAGSGIIGGLDKGAPRQKGFARAMVLVFIANVICTLINPVTYHALIFPFMLTGQKVYMQGIGEWQPLSASYLWGYGLRYTWGFSLLTILGVAGFVWRRRAADITGVLLFVIFFVMAVKGIRLMAEFAIATTPVVFGSLSVLYARCVRTGTLARAAALILVVCVAGPLTYMTTTYSLGLGVKKNIFPEEAVSFIEREDIGGNVFNSFGFGDYLVWRSFPEKKVLIHGRNEVFPQSFYLEYREAYTSAAKWREMTERYGITYALLEYYLTDYEGKERVAHLAHNHDWVPVYWDRLAIVYVKRTPENMGVIEKWGYRYIRPNYIDLSYLNSTLSNGHATEVLDEFSRLISSSPDNEEAYLGRAYVYFGLGRRYYPRAMENLSEAVRVNPGNAVTLAGLGMLYQKEGDRDNAREYYRKALEIDPGDEGALRGLESLGRE